MANSSTRPSNIEYKVLAGLLGTLATFVTQRLVAASWTKITGEKPPDPNDPEVPVAVAISWIAASGVGLGLVQLLVSRFAVKRWAIAQQPKADSQK